MNEVLEVNNLKKELDNFSLDQLDFSLVEGCITGFIGVNGSGKTTTIKTILGLYPKDDGSIKFFGKEMEKNEYAVKNRIQCTIYEGVLYCLTYLG